MVKFIYTMEIIILIWVFIGIIVQVLKHRWRGFLTVRGAENSVWAIFLGPYGLKSLAKEFPKKFDFDFLHKILWKKK